MENIFLCTIIAIYAIRVRFPLDLSFINTLIGDHRVVVEQ